MQALADGSVQLVVTSPPYPMIEMWDEMFRRQSRAVGQALQSGEGFKAFELMHAQLDAVWQEVFRVLIPGGIACINIGDATRTLNGNFALYPNHARILSRMLTIGFSPLPAVIWRKQTNAPNKFMGSGMLPAGAYVTLEHEYILILRKGGKRVFEPSAQAQNRRESALFWEERNGWYSDVWMDLKGTRQNTADGDARKRSAAFPFELPYRLVNMYSARGDTVLDPFLGIGTTMLAAMASGRNSIGFELETEFREIIAARADHVLSLGNATIEARLHNHLEFVRSREQTKGPLKHRNRHYGFPVMTLQEKDLRLHRLESVRPARRRHVHRHLRRLPGNGSSRS